MKRLIVVGLAVFVFAQAAKAQYGGDCSVYNVGWSSNQSTSDNKEHVSLDHRDVVNFTGNCSYTGANRSGACAIQCSETTTGLYSDGEDLTNPLFKHVLNDSKISGAGGSNGPSVTCGGQVAFGVLSCLKVVGCNLTITINGSYQGLGGSATYNPTSTLFQSPLSHPYTCGARTSPGCIMNPDAEPTTNPGGASGYWVWVGIPTCAWQWHRLGNTPIIIDTDGSGFHLTSAENGIKFDFFGNGEIIQVAWTAPNSTNGWLAIDLNGNGVIDSGQELFGDASPQPPLAPNEPDSDLNGFRALAQYDTNGDGVINKEDPVWDRLLIWIDSNHDGISEPNELHGLDSFGIHSISLSYTKSPMTDQYGNQFKLKGHINPGKNGDANRVIYDVNLKSLK